MACAGDTTDNDPTIVTNVQLDSDPFNGTLNVVVGDVASVTGAATALGNTLSVDVNTGGLVLDNTQTLNGAGLAQSTFNVDSARDSLDSLATAFGNSATITTCCGAIDAVSVQTTGVNAGITAISDVNIGNWAMNPSSSATAVANAISYETWIGDYINGWAGQTNNAPVLADAAIDAPFVADSAIATATAMGNSALAGGENATLDVDANQDNFGPGISAMARINAGDSEDVIATATATGNGYTVDNAFGFAKVRSTQDNSAAIIAESEVTLGNWDGWNASTAYAVANSTMVSNIGSDIDLEAIQNNDGDVTATSSFTGGVAGNGVTDFVASSAAFGNAVSGFICTTCSGGITGSANQTNAGNISATTTVNASSDGTIIGTATAVGNSATFHTVTTGD